MLPAIEATGWWDALCCGQLPAVMFACGKWPVPELQGQGIGRALVEYAEAAARQGGCCRMVLHARETAVPFYEKLGYSRVGQRFEEVTIPHWAMERRL